MATRTESIISKALELLKMNPIGIRYSDLIRKLQTEFPLFPVNTMHGVIWNLETRVPDKVYKLHGESSGLRYLRRKSTRKMKNHPCCREKKEETFTKPFADWLVNELENAPKQSHLVEISSKTNGEHRT